MTKRIQKPRKATKRVLADMAYALCRIEREVQALRIAKVSPRSGLFRRLNAVRERQMRMLVAQASV